MKKTKQNQYKMEVNGMKVKVFKSRRDNQYYAVAKSDVTMPVTSPQSKTSRKERFLRLNTTRLREAERNAKTMVAGLV